MANGHGKNALNPANEGSNGNDDITGSVNDDSIHGGNGKDHILGDLGNDRLWGDNGSDHLDGGDGNDTLDGGNGKDDLAGGNGDDKLDGGNGKDNLSGGAGNDSLNGGSGNDTLVDDGGGNDTLVGGQGGDHFELTDHTLVGSLDSREVVLTGGQGNDTFAFDFTSDGLAGGAITRDYTVTDFDVKHDKLSISSLVGGVAHNDAAAIVNVAFVGGDTVLTLDNTDSMTATITLVGVDATEWADVKYA